MNLPSDYVQGILLFSLTAISLLLLCANILKEEEDKEIYSEEVNKWIREGV